MALALFENHFPKAILRLTVHVKNDPPGDRRRNAVAGDAEIGPGVHPGHSGYHQTLAGFVVGWSQLVVRFRNVWVNSRMPRINCRVIELKREKQLLEGGRLD